MSGRAVPFHCPYCGDEDLRPSEEGHGAWECHACLRAFKVTMVGQLRPPSSTASSSSSSATASPSSPSPTSTPGGAR